jgi:hypothetical protein
MCRVRTNNFRLRVLVFPHNMDVFNYGSNVQLEHYRLSSQNPSSNNTTRTPTDDLLNASYPTNQVKISLGTLLATPQRVILENVS